MNKEGKSKDGRDGERFRGIKREGVSVRMGGRE